MRRSVVGGLGISSPFCPVRPTDVPWGEIWIVGKPFNGLCPDYTAKHPLATQSKIVLLGAADMSIGGQRTCRKDVDARFIG